MLRAVRLSVDELGLKLVREPRDDLVLHVEEIGERLVEPFGPQVRASLGLDQLHIDAHAISRALHAAFEHVANVEFASDLFEVGRLAFVGKSCAAADHEGAGNAREVGGQALGDAVDEIVLRRVAADVGEGQNDDGEAGRAAVAALRGAVRTG